MKVLKKISLVLLLTILIIAHSISTGLASNKKNKPQRTDFNSYLANRYLTYSQYKAEIKDHKNSKYFADKGTLALKNEDVSPENPEDWRSKFILKSLNFDELLKAREELDSILSIKKAKDSYPLETANLQFLYDCWLSEESVYEKFDQISKCKVKFFVLKDYIEDAVTPKEIVSETVEDEYLIGKRYIAEGVEYNVYFDFNSYKLNRNANQTIILLINFLDAMKGDYKLTLEGHTDRVGKKLYNDSLARKRVLAVKNKLQKNGVSKDLFTITSSGEKNPKIITKNEEREKLNRRVTIRIEEFNNDFSPVPLPLN